MSPTWPISIRSPGLPCSSIISFLARMKLESLPVRPTALPPAWLMRLTISFIDLAAEHHLDDFHGLGVGDAHALDELALLADAGEDGLDLRAAAVDDHRVEAHQLEQHHVVGEAFLAGAGRSSRCRRTPDDQGLVLEATGCGAGPRR